MGYSSTGLENNSAQTMWTMDGPFKRFRGELLWYFNNSLRLLTSFVLRICLMLNLKSGRLIFLVEEIPRQCNFDSFEWLVKSNNKGNLCTNAIQGATLYPLGSQTWQCPPHDPRFQVGMDTWVKGLWSLSPWLRRAPKVSCVVGKSLHEAIAKPMHEDEKVKPGLSGDPKVLEVPGPWDSKKSYIWRVEASQEREAWCSQQKRIARWFSTCGSR